jgi:hypothetical protein
MLSLRRPLSHHFHCDSSPISGAFLVNTLKPLTTDTINTITPPYPCFLDFLLDLSYITLFNLIHLEYAVIARRK